MKETIHIGIKGMYCSACSGRIEKTVSKLAGIYDVTVNLATEKGKVVFDSDSINKGQILERISKLGYVPTLMNQKAIKQNIKKDAEINALAWKVLFSVIFAIPLILAMLVQESWIQISIPEVFFNPWFQLVLATPVQFIIAYPFYEGAWNAIKNRSPTMDVLVVISTTSAYFYSHFLTVRSFSNDNDYGHLHYETSVLIITFVLLGKLMEAKTKRKTLDAIHSLNNLRVHTATIIENGKEVRKAITDILPGDIILAKPGETIPIDGQVVGGSTMINESMLTGESIPIEKKPGDIVYAGTLNLNKAIKFKASKIYTDTVLAKIIEIVEDAQLSKPPIQNIADRFTSIFVPIVLLLGFLTFLLWSFILAPGVVNEAIEKMIAVLIISCPCALGLATPMSIMVGSGRAAKMGIFIKEGKMIEFLSKNNIVVLDKTGTITTGKPRVTDIFTRNIDQNVFFQLVGSIEKNANHPIGYSIVNAVEQKVDVVPLATKTEVIFGYGVEGNVNGNHVVIANIKYFERLQGANLSRIQQHVQLLQKEGKTVVLVSINNHINGIIAVKDEINGSSKKAVAQLKRMGLKVIMLSGDHYVSTKNIAKEVGIHQFEAEVTPQMKADWIKSYQKAGNKIMMVGDGINDAPALSIADVGVAIGTGADIAMETGDVTIMNGDLNRLVDAIRISKKTMINIKQNFSWAFIYNIICIPLAIIGILPPWFASAAMAFSSVSVVLNSLRLKNA